MSKSPSSGTIRAQALIGRKVRDAFGKKLGRVYDMETGRVGDELRVTALLVGPGSWLARFGWSRHEHGRRVPWEQIEGLSPDITVRAERV
ncbi:MAG TPA: PRC-barrel domain-containing protein [Chloroflexota bacterium]